MSINWQKIKLWFYILLLGGAVRGAFFFNYLHAPLAITEELIYQVLPGVSLTQVVNELEEVGVLKHPDDLLIYARLSSKADRIQAGEFAFPVGISPLQLLDKLVNGDVYYRQLVLVEGWTALQALQAIQANDYIEATIDTDDREELQDILGLELHAEGQFFPDTYNFTRGTTDREILERANVMMNDVLAREWEMRDVGLPYENPYEALIMASVIEKETAVAAEREQIAGVFVRRLEQGMRLQTDPTVIYGLGNNYDGNLKREDLSFDTAYNTYTHYGLPPTPISLPGRAAISASLHPDQSNSLYFVAKGDGSHYFSESLAEHNDAVRRYQVDMRSEEKP